MLLLVSGMSTCFKEGPNNVIVVEFRGHEMNASQAATGARLYCKEFASCGMKGHLHLP